MGMRAQPHRPFRQATTRLSSALFEMNAVLVPLVARREEPTLEGAAARASGVDVEAPRLDCSADEWHDIERPRERRNQPSCVSGPRANASDAGLCNMARRRLRPTLRARVGRVSGRTKNVRNRHKIQLQSVGSGRPVNFLVTFH